MMGGDEINTATVRTVRSVLFNEANYLPYPSTRQILFGLGELIMGSFSVVGYNADRISISLDMLPDNKTTRVIVSDNGKAHEDTVEACYDNAISLICEKRSNITDGVASQESGFSKNGVGCGTALKHMAGDIQHIIGSHILVRHGKKIDLDKLESGKKNARAEVIIATFDLKYYLSRDWKDTDLPLLNFYNELRMSNSLRRHETAEAFNILSFIPLDETVEPRLSASMRQERKAQNMEKGVKPLECQPEECFRQHVEKHAEVRGDNTGFSTALFDPHGTWEATGPDGSDIVFNADETPHMKASVKRMFETAFWQPIFNFEDLIQSNRGPHTIEDLLNMSNTEPGHNVKVQVNGGEDFMVGQLLEDFLVSCQEDERLLFLHRASKSDAMVIGTWPKSIDTIAKALPLDLLCDQSPSNHAVPIKEWQQGVAQNRVPDRCGVLVFHMAHNKVFRVTMHRTHEYYSRNCTMVKRLSDLLKKKDLTKSQLPVPFRGDLTQEDEQRLRLLGKPQYHDLAQRVLLDEETPMCLFLFAKHTLLDDSKTNYKEFTDDIEGRILPEALRGYFAPLIDERTKEVEAEEARNKAKRDAAKQQGQHHPEEALSDGSQDDDTSPSAPPPTPETLPRSQRRRAAAHAARQSIASQVHMTAHVTDARGRSPARASNGAGHAKKKTKKRPRPPPHPSFKNLQIPQEVRDTHDLFSFLASKTGKKPASSASQSSTLAPGTWVAVAFGSDEEEDDGSSTQLYYAGVVKDKIKVTAGGARAGGQWYRIFFTGIFWDDHGNVDYDDQDHGFHEIDIAEGAFLTLAGDPLAA